MMRAPFASLSVRAWSSPCVLGAARPMTSSFWLAISVALPIYLPSCSFRVETEILQENWKTERLPDNRQVFYKGP